MNEDQIAKINWESIAKVNKALDDRDFQRAKASLEALERQDTPDSFKCVVEMTYANYFAETGELSEALRRLNSARSIIGDKDRIVLSQVDLQEASLTHQAGRYDEAISMYRGIQRRYADILANPDHQDFRLELLCRLAYSLVHARKYREAIPILNEALQEPNADRQRILLYLGAALKEAGRRREAEAALLEASKGRDQALSKDALNRLGHFGGAGPT